MKTTVALFVIKQAIKFLKNHPDLVPGHVDDFVVKYLAEAFGV